MVAVKTVGTHPIAVKHLRMGDDLACCHMVFFRASERKNTPAAIASSENANVLQDIHKCLIASGHWSLWWRSSICGYPEGHGGGKNCRNTPDRREAPQDGG